VLSSPWSLEFVVAVIIGAMLVPGCRADTGRSNPAVVSTEEFSRLSSDRTDRVFRLGRVEDTPETPPVAPEPVEPAHPRQP
jgi:hypothetical protein